MSSFSNFDWLRPYSVPVIISSILVIGAIIVPPLVLGEVTTETYVITAAVIILAVSATLPYALLVGIGTLPFLYTGFASYAAPQPSADTAHPFSPAAALRHVVVGVGYVLVAAVVGAIGFGSQMGIPAREAPRALGGQPAFLVLGGLIIAATFVTLQLWRYDTALRTLDRKILLGTVVLGLPVAVSPIVAFWIFNAT